MNLNQEVKTNQEVKNRGKSLGTGRRKKSVCRVKLTPCSKGTGWIQINRKPYDLYMQQQTILMNKVKAPLTFLGLDFEALRLEVHVYGGGLVGQADAIKLALSRALIEFDPDYQVSLRVKEYLTQDARNKERKKYGLKKARKSPQFSKR